MSYRSRNLRKTVRQHHQAAANQLWLRKLQAVITSPDWQDKAAAARLGLTVAQVEELRREYLEHGALVTPADRSEEASA